jgi:quinol monooxygenase YgiN
MATLFVRHTVADFDAWKKAYDEFGPQRDALGVTGHGVYQTDGNPNDVTVYHHFDSMGAAKAFMANPKLHEAMKTAGVQGQPTFWFTNRV